MSFIARLLSREGKPIYESWLGLSPRSMSWSALGGCDEAELEPKGSSSLEDWKGFLGNPIEIYDALGRLHWWGWLEALSQNLPGMQTTYDLAKMANRVAVAYAPLEAGNALDSGMQTSWADDLESQALYGVKERLLRGGALTLEQAEHWRDIELHRWRMPALKATPSAKKAEEAIRLRCKGWIHRLDWRVWQRESGVVGNVAMQHGVQAVGSDSQTAQIAQSFKIRRDVLLSSIDLRLRKQGTPSDQLRVDIRADNNGSPASGNLASCSMDTSAMSNEAYAWVRGVFPAQVSLRAGNSYWFVLSRTGAVDAENHYLMAVDENLHFEDGRMLIFRPFAQDWVPRQPEADALFKLTLLSRVEDELNAMLALAGDILNGFALETTIGLRLPLSATMGMPLLKALKSILALGSVNRDILLMDLGADRFLRIYGAPQSSELAFWMDDQGELIDRMGQKLKSLNDAIGKRVGGFQGQSFLLKNARLDVESGRFVLKSF